ncbi:MAG: NAD(P)(+) transhydrogenase (Re/Si-specific) subunit beta [Clostridiaceae bacterium]|nr:NAD(P)(+) transhydrogenase (Re/Si-specific) subunit beta [Clostridiaceae bacterium]
MPYVYTALSDVAFYCISGVLVLGVLIGLILMSKPEKARLGNALSAACTLVAIAVTMYHYEILSSWVIWASIAVGTVISLIAAAKVKMIQMPQVVALLNGFGGLASALVAILSYAQANWNEENPDRFAAYTAAVALVIGFVTFTGSLVAAGKLHKVLPQKPVVIPGHTAIIVALIVATVVCVALGSIVPIWVTAILACIFGVVFAIRVGGADMPITISLLNSLSGVAGGIAGIAVGNILLVAIGGIVGASGLLLTRVMCKAMNRKLLGILLGSTSVSGKKSEAVEEAAEPAEESAEDTAQAAAEEAVEEAEEEVAEEAAPAVSVADILAGAKKVIIVPGYGMALAQAQAQVKALADKLEANGAEVKFAIHPVAGRMPGHMNVLLCEVDVPYDKLYEMDNINGEFAECDVAIIIGASDVVNPAANTAEGTPIYGMPVLNAADAPHIIVCNFDEKPGYAGVPNPIYTNPKTIMKLGDAKETVQELIDSF